MTEYAPDIGRYYSEQTELQNAGCLFCSRPKLSGHNKGCPVLGPEGESIMEGVQSEFLEKYSEWVWTGPKVGETNVRNKETGQAESVDVCVQNIDYGLKFTLLSPEGIPLAYTELEELNVAGGRPVNNFEIGNRLVENPLKNYGDNLADSDPRLYVGLMKSDGRHRYSGLGFRSHEIAVERSFQIGGNGRVQLMIGGIQSSGLGWGQESPGTSGAFHEAFGFRGQEVRWADGEVHHTADIIHTQIEHARDEAFNANMRMRDYYLQKGEPDKAAEYSISKEKIHLVGPNFYSDELPYMYLPEQIINREKERIDAEPILQANASTIKALLAKHHYLLSLEAASTTLERRLEDCLQHPAEVRPELWESLAESYEELGNTARAHELFLRAATEYEKTGHELSRPYWYGAAGNVYRKLGQESLAQKCFRQALVFSQAQNDAKEQRDYYLQGTQDEPLIRSEYRDY